jgi:PTS system fructose-specific IIA component/PTS system nitrogen regulatory IIA component
MSIASGQDDFGFPAIDLPGDLNSAEDVARFLIEELARRGDVSPQQVDSLLEAILKREELGSTAIGRGVALPHAKSAAIDRVLGIIGRSKRPIRWSSQPNSQPVTAVYLLLTPKSRPGDGLSALEAVSRWLRNLSDDV